MKRYIAPLAIVLSLFSASAQASAIADTFQHYNFSGVCTDCNLTSHLPALGELVLKNYVAGTAISNANFVSFHYDATDQLAAFTILRADVGYLLGTMSGSLTAPSRFGVASNIDSFGSSNSGNWSTDLSDEGTGGTFTIANSSAVPEPGTLALLGLGLAGIGGLMRRRQQG